MGKQTTSGQLVHFAEWQMWESTAVQSTESQSFQSAILRTAKPLAEGTYRLQWHFEMRLVAAGGVNSKAAARFLYDGSNTGVHLTIETDWQTVSGWDRKANVIEGATPTFEIQFRRDPTVGGNDAVEIRRMKMSFENMEE